MATKNVTVMELFGNIVETAIKNPNLLEWSRKELIAQARTTKVWIEGAVEREQRDIKEVAKAEKKAARVERAAREAKNKK